MVKQNNLHPQNTKWLTHLTSAEEEKVEHFPTAQLIDDVWMEEPVPDRHICIHEQSQPHDLCP